MLLCVFVCAWACCVYGGVYVEELTGAWGGVSKSEWREGGLHNPSGGIQIKRGSRSHLEKILSNRFANMSEQVRLGRKKELLSLRTTHPRKGS